jgi:hypothetical protein
MKTKIKNLYTNEIEELLCLVGRIDREIMNFSHVSEHLPNSIKRELDDANRLGAWDYALEDTTEVIAIEDHYGDGNYAPSVTYNGWLNDLENLIKNIS